MLHLKLIREPTVPLEAEVLSPTKLASLKNAEIRGLTIYHGKRQCRLDEFFEVAGDGCSELRIEGNLRKVRWIGRAMREGSIYVDGSVGMHLGAYMRGGSIEITGDASDWVGAEMKNGLIKIHGNAGGQIGGGYRGSLAGMTNGFIHVGGTTGLEVGLRMRRGTIVLGGKARDFAGLQMKGGTIVLLDGAEIRTGAWMNRGTIISMKPLQMMPTFSASTPFDSPFLPIFLQHLGQQGIEIPNTSDSGCYRRYTGDKAVLGKGEILVWNPQPSAL